MPATPTPAETDDVQMGGASAAAGVLTAWDEDEEGGEEAPVPDAFEVEESDEDEMRE
jgi:26S proteasome regulatory subunit N2